MQIALSPPPHHDRPSAAQTYVDLPHRPGDSGRNESRGESGEGQMDGRAVSTGAEEAESQGDAARRARAAARRTKGFDLRICGPFGSSHLQERVWEMLSDPASSTYAMIIWFVIMATIVFSTLAFIVETSHEYYSPEPDTSSTFFVMEAICIGIFVAEISARVWSAPTVGYYFRDFMNWIDIAAVVPFFVDLGVSSGQIPGLQVVRVLRLTRAMRLLKLSQTHLRVLGKAMKLSLPVLYMLLLLLMMVMVLFGTLVWFVNHGELSEIVEMWTQRNAYVCDVKVLRTLPTDWAAFDVASELVDGCELVSDDGVDAATGQYAATFSCPHYYNLDSAACERINEVTAFQSIPHSMWLSIVTFTTVGFGEIVPTTAAGKVMGGLQCIVGLLAVALPATVIQANFEQIFREEEARAGKKAKLKDRMRSMITKASNRAKRFSMKMPSLRQGPAAT